MLTVGLVGGLGPESTIDYYRRILQIWEETRPGSAPSIVIHSLDVTYGIELVRHDRAALVDYLLSSLDRLAGAGCDFAAMAANTPHIVFQAVAPQSPLPLVSIVEVCADEASARGFSRVGLLGTGFTMEAGFYNQVFRTRGIDVAVPAASDRSWLHERYLGELLKGDFRPETRAGVVSLIRRMVVELGIEAVILAGTELPLLLDSSPGEGVPLLDTAELHVRAIVARLANGTSQGAT